MKNDRALFFKQVFLSEERLCKNSLGNNKKKYKCNTVIF